MSCDERRAQDALITAYAVQWLEKHKGSVLIYNSLPSEVSTAQLVRYLTEEGRKVYMPVMRGGDIAVVPVNRSTAFTGGAYGICEPLGDSIAAEHADIDICITPLDAYTDNGGRVGKGKGCYDRFFARCRKCIKVALAYCCQYVPRVKTDAHDVPMDVIINGRGVVGEDNIRQA